MEYTISYNFSRLKPVCDNIALHARVEDIVELKQIIKELDEYSLKSMLMYVIFPFKILLIRRNNEVVTITAIDFLSYLFEKCGIENWSIFSGCFEQLSNLLLMPGKEIKVCVGSEEFKSSVCLCISSLVKTSKEEIVNEMYQIAFRLPFAQIFYTLIHLLKNEKSKSLRKIVLQTIAVLTFNSNHLQLQSEVVKQSASYALAGLFPGLATVLSQIICGDFKQGQGVLRMALNILGDLIVLVLGDSVPVDSTKIKTLTDKSEVTNVVKNETWFKETSVRLHFLVKQCTKIVSHENSKVRLEFLKFSESILLNCSKHLENCVPILLDPVFALSVDPYECALSAAKCLITQYSQRLQSSDSMSLYSLIMDNIYLSTSKLIQSKLSANDVQKLIVLRSIQGYIQVLGNSIDRLVLSSNHIEKFVMSLINLLEFDTSMISIVEEISTQWDISVNPNVWPKKRFLYFQNDEILVTICNICQCLGESERRQSILNFLIEKLHASELYLLQSIFLIGCIVEGFPKHLDSTIEQSESIKDIIDELLSILGDVEEYKDNSAVQIFKSQLDQFSNSALYSNYKLLQICLILESIAKCTKALGTEFRIFLTKVLFNVMETAGSSNYILAHSGRLCLYCISHSCGYGSVLELIKENADYIVNGISVNFHHFLYRPEMTVVLRVVIEESDGTMLPLFSDSINQVIRILDLNQDKAYSLLIVLKTVALSIKKWFPHTEKEVPRLIAEDLKMHFLKKKSLIESTENSTCIDANEENDIEISDEYDSKKEPLLHVKILSAILKRCSHLQSSNILFIQVLSLEIMEICIVALRDFELQLHPLIHQLWNPFIPRFSEDQKVILHAFRVLLVIVEECYDFVRPRILKDIIPKLISVLKDCYSSSLLKNNFRNYQWTNSCKLQLCVLSKIGSLLCKLDASGKDIAAVAEVCLPFLQSEQPKIIQSAAFQTFEDLAKIEPDAIWWYINQTYSQSPVTSPYDTFKEIHFPFAKVTNFELELNF